MSKERRMEKAWRHRDRELKGTHVLSSSMITLNAILLTAFSIILKNSDIIIPMIFTIIFFIFTISSVFTISINIRIIRNLDRDRAKYFEDSVYPVYIDNTEEHDKKDNEYKEKLQRESNNIIVRERISIILTFGSIVLLFIALVY